MDTKALLDSIGGKVRASFDNGVNTCAFRMSWCLNRSGQPIRWQSGVRFYEGAARKLEPRMYGPPAPELYVASADEMRTYLDAAYGRGRLIYDASVKPTRVDLGGRKDVQGVIVFDWFGAPRVFGASGHVDLFYIIDQGVETTPRFAPACAGACYWQDSNQPMRAYLWETLP